MTFQEAEKLLKEAVCNNPGLWEQHSYSVANNARLIAERVQNMDSEKAAVLGLLHDIGRKEGVTGIRHIFDGHDYMLSISEKDVARICLSHSFPVKDADAFVGRYDCTEEQLQFLRDFLENAHYDDYDRLIQLCDAISLPNGACIMEKRLVDVALRHGLPDCTLKKWRAFMELKKYFDKLCGCNIYQLLPNVIENTIDNL